MDKIIEFGEIFSPGSTSFNPLLILPILVVVFGVVAVFLFGFKKTENPNFKKFSEPNSANSNNKKLKRNTLDTIANQNMAKPLVKASLKAKYQKRENVSTTTSKISTSKSLNDKPKKNITESTNTNSPIRVSKDDNKKAKPVNNKKFTKEKKSGSKNLEKPLDNSSNDGGEWQTVITKKQKKSTNDLLIQAVAEAAAGATVKTNENKASEKTNNKHAKDEANRTKKATSEKQRQKLSAEVPSDVIDNKKYEDQIETDIYIPVADNSKQNKADLPEHQTTLVEVATVVTGSPESSVAFNEMGDTTWTEAKPLKKSKKRALRE